jgi:hypothetical protein
LRGDSSQNIRGLVNFDILPYLGATLDTPRVLDGDLRLGIDHIVDDLADAKHLDLAGLPIEPGMQILLRPIVFFSCSQYGILYRTNDDIRIDILLPADLLDGPVE